MKLKDITSEAELSAHVKSMVDKALAPSLSSITKLEDKNSELLGKLRKAKDDNNQDSDEVKALRKKAKEFDNLETKKLEEEGEYKKLVEVMKAQHEEELEKVKNANTLSDKEIKRLLIDQSLTSELSANNVNPVLIEAAVGILSGKISIIEKDGKKVAMVGDKNVKDYVKDWSATDVGKNFVLANKNAGGGSGGNGDAGDKGNAILKPFLRDTWNKTEQHKLFASDPEKHKELSAKYPTRDTGSNQKDAA